MLINANALHIPLADGSVHTIVTSPPYYGLRDYGTAKWEGGDPDCKHYIAGDGEPGITHAGEKQQTNHGSMRVAKDICPHCGATRIDEQIGLEQTPDAYIAILVEVFRECKRILRDDGTLWVNIGDSYASMKSRYSQKAQSLNGGKPQDNEFQGNKTDLYHHPELGLKDKDLIGIPWMLAFALRADGWWLRQDIIWCLSGGAYVYAKTQKGVLPMMVRDIYRLNPTTVKLWNGEKWTQLLGINKSHRRGDELEIVLRSGERISCTPTHKFPTDRGLLMASELKVGDKLIRTQLPDNEYPRDCAIDTDAAWFAGLYLAEGSRSDDCIQIAGHSKEVERLDRVQRIAKKYGGSATCTITGNMMNIRVYGCVLIAILDELVTGRTAKDKGFAPAVWKYSNEFIASMIDGYLSGDGHFDGKRWRLGFTRNYNLERDLRTACARLGYHLILNLSTVKYNGKDVPTFRGELRKQRSGHRNEKNEAEIVEIRRSRCREVYDLGVEDEPHLFALASGILTHNSKPNPMPESVKDRCTKSHEYIFLLSKSARYYYDNEAIMEIATGYDGRKDTMFKGAVKSYDGVMPDGKPQSFAQNGHERWQYKSGVPVRNKRDVWTVTTKPYKGAHYATYPPDLITPCILAGAPETCCAKCGAPYVRLVDRVVGTSKPCPKTQAAHEARGGFGEPVGTVGKSGGSRIDGYSVTLGFQPTCTCNAGTSSGIVFDPFVGSGTTVATAIKLGRKGIGIDLNIKYLTENARQRIADAQKQPRLI